jgi:hypothetical protein
MKYSMERFRKFFTPEINVYVAVICKVKEKTFEVFIAL